MLSVLPCAIFVALLAPGRSTYCCRCDKLCSKTHQNSVLSGCYWLFSPGFEYTVAPLNAPSKMRMGVRTKRGPTSTREVCGGPLGWRGSFSIICYKTGGCILEPAGSSPESSYEPGNCGTRSCYPVLRTSGYDPRRVLLSALVGARRKSCIWSGERELCNSNNDVHG